MNVLRPGPLQDTEGRSGPPDAVDLRDGRSSGHPDRTLEGPAEVAVTGVTREGADAVEVAK